MFLNKFYLFYGYLILFHLFNLESNKNKNNNINLILKVEFLKK